MQCLPVVKQGIIQRQEVDASGKNKRRCYRRHTISSPARKEQEECHRHDGRYVDTDLAGSVFVHLG